MGCTHSNGYKSIADTLISRTIGTHSHRLNKALKASSRTAFGAATSIFLRHSCSGQKTLSQVCRVPTNHQELKTRTSKGRSPEDAAIAALLLLLALAPSPPPWLQLHSSHACFPNKGITDNITATRLSASTYVHPNCTRQQVVEDERTCSVHHPWGSLGTTPAPPAANRIHVLGQCRHYCS